MSACEAAYRFGGVQTSSAATTAATRPEAGKMGQRQRTAIVRRVIAGLGTFTAFSVHSPRNVGMRRAVLL
jgi:hypothetical protein